MEFSNLQAFKAVAERNSFSTAAQALGLTQPAISKRIALLEAELETNLFDRLGRSVELTEAGRALLSHIPAVEKSLGHAERAVRDLNGDVSGPLQLATSHHIGLHRLPPILSSFKRKHPHVRLEIEFLDSEQAYERIRRGEIELAVVTLAPGNVSQLDTEELWEDPLTVMVAPDHPLADRETVTLRELSKYAAVLPGLETFTGRIVRQHFAQAGEALQLGMATNYLETLRMMAAVGLGWTVLPRTMLGEGLQSLKLEDSNLKRSLGVVVHHQRSLSRSARAFHDLLQTEKRSCALPAPTV
ncbi:MAG: LysR substrate-binding domain-containing protein [Pseudomonadota bacterium]